jgi:glycosyltransferase involved in cell wall biosynthesis
MVLTRLHTDTPLVSVIIPAYNVAGDVARAIDSVLGQTYPSVELVVVNDGSTDGTDEAISPYLNRIAYIVQDNQGAAAAYNAGIRQATGQYLAFLGADDYFLPGRLSAVMRVFEQEKHCFVTTDFYLALSGQGAVFQRRAAVAGRFELSTQGQFAAALQENFIFGQVVLPRGILDRVGLFDEALRYNEDWDLWLRCLAAGYRAVLVPEPLAVYRVGRPGSLTRQRTLRKAHDCRRILMKHRDRLPPMPLGRFSGSVCWHTMREAVAAGHWRFALHCALPLLRNTPYCREVLFPRLARWIRKRVRVRARRGGT